jgi:3-hydroxyisobutyrate dehydrogenase
MGGRIARRLLQTGHPVVVWNRTPAKARELVDLGAEPAGSPAEAAGRAEAVITMVSDPTALAAVTEGPEGVAAGVAGSASLLQMSTVGPAAISRLATVLPASVGLLDAPVLGSLSEAESGSLSVFVGGPRPLFDRWAPLLSALGTPIHCGALGAGSAAKLVANSTLFGVLGALGEALALARNLGLARDTTFEVLERTPLAAQAERRRRAVESNEYDVRFSLSLARKDADLIVDVAPSLHLAEAARDWLAEAEAAGWGGRDYSELLAWILRPAERSNDA